MKIVIEYKDKTLVWIFNDKALNNLQIEDIIKIISDSLININKNISDKIESDIKNITTVEDLFGNQD